MRIARLLLPGLALTVLGACSSGFTAEDIDRVKAAIREQYGKDGRYTVLDVVMLKESATKLTGYVRLRTRALGEITRSCSATMEEAGRNFIWRCGN